MAINKKLIHFKNFSDFNSKKLSANENNTQYTLGINGTVTNGSPDILYQSICYIKDTKQQWTHGQLYDGSKLDTPLNETDPVFLASPAATITEANKQAWSNKQDAISDLAAIRNGALKGATAVQPSSLATVATSGSYNDLSNKPTIPAAVTESTVSGWGFTKNTGTYSKPSSGIPKSDLASAVQTSLGKADTALQSYTEQYKGTVTGVKINGTTKSQSNGIVDLGTVITAIKIDGDNRTPGDTLITEPTTIDLGFIHKQLDTMNGSSMALRPNRYYRNTNTSLSSLTITLGSVSNSNIINEYFVEFTTSSSGTTVSLPSKVKWSNGETPTFEAGCTYQVSIVNNFGTIQKFK